MARGSFVFASIILLSLLLAAPRAGGQEADDPDPQRGAANTSTYRVRVAVPYPGAAAEPPLVSSPPPIAPEPPPSGESPPAMVTIAEFPVDGGGPVLSEPLTQTPPEPRVLATLYGMPITEDDVTRELWRRRGVETLEWLIGRDILTRELRRLRLDVADAEIDAALDRHLHTLRKKYPAFRNAADLVRAASGMTLDEYRERIVWTELALRKVMDAELPVDDQSLRVLFDSLKDQYVQDERVLVAQIFIAPAADPDADGLLTPGAWADAERKAREAHELLRHDEFDAVAARFGQADAPPRWYKPGELLRELDGPAFSIREDSITNPIRTSMGYHILMVEKREPRREATLDEVRDDIEAKFRDMRFTRLAGEFMAKLRRDALANGALVITGPP